MTIKSPKAKGRTFENQIVKWFEEMGLRARRQPLSGALADFPHDVDVMLPDGGRLIVEAKKRAKLPATFDRWLGKAGVLIMAQNHAKPADWRVYMTGREFEALVRLAYPGEER